MRLSGARCRHPEFFEATNWRNTTAKSTEAKAGALGKALDRQIRRSSRRSRALLALSYWRNTTANSVKEEARHSARLWVRNTDTAASLAECEPLSKPPTTRARPGSNRTYKRCGPACWGSYYEGSMIKTGPALIFVLTFIRDLLLSHGGGIATGPWNGD
jgi:hypothetical protein